MYIQITLSSSYSLIHDICHKIACQEDLVQACQEDSESVNMVLIHD